MPLDFDPTRPIYLQIIEAVKKRTAQGVYQAGGPLPSVREMAKEMGVNPNTMSRAYMELEREGFITTRRGEGSSITESAKRIDSERRALAGPHATALSPRSATWRSHANKSTTCCAKFQRR